MTWEDIPLIDQNGIILTYEVLYEPLETFDGNITEQRVNTTNFSITQMDLEEFVDYSISVRGYTIVGPGNYSVPVVVMTQEDGILLYHYIADDYDCFICFFVFFTVPAIAPINVQSEVLSSTSINVTWEEIPPIKRNGIITSYEVLYEPLDTFDGAIGPAIVNTTNLYYVLVGLEEYVDYNISVRAYTRAGFGPYSQEITNQTFQDSEYFITRAWEY